jgi:hypothetical protein
MKTQKFKVPGRKFDENKPRWSLLPLETIEQIVTVLTYGAKKYGVNSWQNLDNFYDRYESALMRHLTQWQSGKQYDSDFYERYGIKVSHLAMVATNAIFLLWKELQDNISKKETEQ